jgi:hypothetical protein
MFNANYSTYNRRHFMKHMAGMSLMAVPGMQFLAGLRAASETLKKTNKSLIVLWMGGGPATIDMWDLKPGTDNGGEFKTIKTTVSGMEISEHLPTVASQGKHMTIVRSLVTNEGSHERGHSLMHTARQPSPVVSYPSIGSIISHELTPKELDLPGYISIGAPSDGPGFLGMNYAPFTVQNPGQPPANIKMPTSLHDDMDRVRRRQNLFYNLEDGFIGNVSGRSTSKSESVDAASAAIAHEKVYDKAFKLVASPRGKVFDLSSEKKSVLDAYGNTNFGRGCCLARRLVEAGVNACEVSLGGWDTHANTFTAHKTNLQPAVDKGFGTLVKDLDERGMLKNTVVLWMGEFGRTPRINQNAGRDHWARCWSIAMAGGALKGGQVYGSTSSDGMDVEKDPCSIGDVFATVFKALGIDPKLQIRDNLGRPTDMAPGKVLTQLV